MGQCKFCKKEDIVISQVLSICRKCLFKEEWTNVKPYLEDIHDQVRLMAGLPSKPPKVSKPEEKLRCNLCINECSLGSTDTSYCGLRNLQKHRDGEILLPKKSRGYIHGYLDGNPTNCCNSWFCPAGTTKGYPHFSKINGPEFGTYSYAAFLYGCTFNCLFCQNSSHKHFTKQHLHNAEDLATKILNNKKTTCLCYFGGTPEAQLPFTINLSEIILERIRNSGEDRIFRFCWEWNGSGNQDMIERCMEIAIETGGNIKFDLKAYEDKLHLALCGINNTRTLNNFKFLADKYYGTRKDLPELSACTLLVPGYLNYEEVEKISIFISEINDEIPYSLLVFHPDYQMQDLPITPREQAMKCYKTAKKYLKHVNLGNKFLLGFS